MAELRETCLRDNQRERKGVQLTELECSHINAKGKDSGSSACMFIQAFLTICWLLDCTSLPRRAAAWRKYLVEKVTLFDEMCAQNKQTQAVAEFDLNGGTSKPVLEKVASILKVKLRTFEPILFNEKGDPVEVWSANDVEAALELADLQFVGAYASCFTVPKNDGSSTGDSFGYFDDRFSLQVVDTHRRVDSNGNNLGMVHARADRDNRRSLVEWICDELLVQLLCHPHFSVHFIQIDWEWYVEDCISKEQTLLKIIALGPVISKEESLPGDFIQHCFGNSRFLQLLSTGMKLYPIQTHLSKSVGRFGGLSTLDDAGGSDSVWRWLIDAWLHAEDVPESRTAHGKTLGTGPTWFLRQLFIIQNTEPYPGAEPVREDGDKRHFITSTPTVCIEMLRAGLEHINFDITTGEEYLQSQADLIALLSRVLVEVSPNYTAPYLGKKLIHLCAPSQEFIGIPLRKGMVVSANRKGGLKCFAPETPMHIVASKLNCHGALIWMWFCLVEGVKATPEQIHNNIDKILDALQTFLSEHKFAPSPCQLLEIADIDTGAEPPAREAKNPLNSNYDEPANCSSLIVVEDEDHGDNAEAFLQEDTTDIMYGAPVPEKLHGDKMDKEMKEIIKEGGKRGVEIEGAADTTMQEPNGDVNLLGESLRAVNAMSDPSEEEEEKLEKEKKQEGGEGQNVGDSALEDFPEALEEAREVNAEHILENNAKDFLARRAEDDATEEENAENGATEKNRRKRRKKEEVEARGVDTNLCLREVLEEIKPLRMELERLCGSEVFIQSGDDVEGSSSKGKRSEILTLCEKLRRLPICPGCFSEVPTRPCRDSGVEAWKPFAIVGEAGDVEHRTLCSYCKIDGPFNFTKKHFEHVRESLRRRVRSEVELAIRLETKEATKDLAQKLTKLQISYGQGGGPKTSKKYLSEVWLVGQLYRTAERLSLDQTLREERLVILTALNHLQAR